MIENRLENGKEKKRKGKIIWSYLASGSDECFFLGYDHTLRFIKNILTFSYLLVSWFVFSNNFFSL